MAVKKKKLKSGAESVLREIMSYLGPTANPIWCDKCTDPKIVCRQCYRDAMWEMEQALKLIHKYFGKVKVRQIYKEIGYSTRVIK